MCTIPDSLWTLLMIYIETLLINTLYTCIMDIQLLVKMYVISYKNISLFLPTGLKISK